MSEQTKPARETRDVTLPSGAVVTFVGFFTGADIREVTRALYRSVKLKKVGEGLEASMENLNLAQCEQDQEDVLLTKAVVGVNGETDDILNRLLALPADDWAVVVDEAKKLQTPATKS